MNLTTSNLFFRFGKQCYTLGDMKTVVQDDW